MRANWRTVACALVIAATAACGTTVPSAQRTVGATTQGDELGGTITPSTDPSVVAADDTASTALAATANTVAPAGGVRSTTTRPAARTSAPIRVGILYAKPADAGFAAIGAGGLSNGDEKAMAQIAIDDANTHGGFGGRKIVPVYFGFDANPGAPDFPTQAQSACSALTEDTTIDLLLGEPEIGPLSECLNKRGIPVIGEGSNAGLTRATFNALPLMVHLGGFNLDRRATAQIASLVEQKYFTPWDTIGGRPGQLPVKVGIITYDIPDFITSAQNSLAPAVTAAGFGKPDIVRVAYHNSYAELASAGVQLASAVLRFKTLGVTHVLIWDDNGISTLFFLTHAASQGYYPRFGINTGNNMLLLTSAGLVSLREANGAIGIGWRPVLDSPDAADPNGRFTSAARRACTALMVKHGGTVKGKVLPTALADCTNISAAKAVYDAHGGQLNGAGLIAGLESLGSSLFDIQTPAIYLARGRHDGLGAYYQFGWIPSCSCMNYLSAARPLPH